MKRRLLVCVEITCGIFCDKIFCGELHYYIFVHALSSKATIFLSTFKFEIRSSSPSMMLITTDDDLVQLEFEVADIFVALTIVAYDLSLGFLAWIVLLLLKENGRS